MSKKQETILFIFFFACLIMAIVLTQIDNKINAQSTGAISSAVIKYK